MSARRVPGARIDRRVATTGSANAPTTSRRSA